MANIKFSDFTVGNTEGDIDFVVGYKGASNIQISPTNLLASALGNYLPLAGGTMTGTSGVIFPDTFKLNLGTSSDFNIYHSGSHSYLENYTGDIIIQNNADDKDIIFQSDDGAGGVATYFYLDGSAGGTNPATVFPDNSALYFGTGTDFHLKHNGSNSYIENETGNLYIIQDADDSDIIFRADDGSGGVENYIQIDGSEGRTLFNKDIRVNDDVQVQAGNSADLKIFHDGTDSVIQNDTGDLEIQNRQNDGDIVFKSDDGSGDVATYFYLDGSIVENRFSKATRHSDNIIAKFGDANDLNIYSNGSNSYIENFNNDFIISNTATDKDIRFFCDNGSGGTTEYIRVDGSATTTVFSKNTRYDDNVELRLGSGSDFKAYHSGTNTVFENDNGHLYIKNTAVDKDIIFEADNGSGGVAEYFKLDGSTASGGSLYTQFPDSSNLTFGAGNDLRIYHNGTNSNIENFNGALQFVQNLNDGDINFLCDDGAGGVATYFLLDGSLADGTNFYTRFLDRSRACFGDSIDLQVFHNGTNSYIENNTGHLFITNGSNDGDLVFKSDDGSGGTATYFALDGGITRTVVYKNFNFQDNVKLEMGTGADLQIYHDGSNSYIDDVGTGWIKIRGNGGVLLESYSEGETMVKASRNSSVELYYDNVKKFETTSTGIKITGISEYADNTAAIAGGLTTGDVYRTGDLLKIVH